MDFDKHVQGRNSLCDNVIFFILSYDVKYAL
jgi:hypothetical protein